MASWTGCCLQIAKGNHSATVADGRQPSRPCRLLPISHFPTAAQARLAEEVTQVAVYLLPVVFPEQRILAGPHPNVTLENLSLAAP